MKITASQLRRIIRETIEEDPRLTSSRRFALAGSLQRGSIAIDNELSTIEKALKPVAANPDQKISSVVSQIISALSKAREATSELKSLSARVEESSPQK